MMNYSEEILETAGETVEYARQYTHQQFEYYKLELAERLAKTSAALITTTAVAFAAILAVVMLSVAAGFYLGKLWNSNALAFLCVAGVYFLLALSFYIFRRRWITNPMLSMILRSFLT